LTPAQLVDVRAVVVTYNSIAYVTQCLDSILQEGVADVVVVDNASQDGSAHAAERLFDERVRVVRLDENVGFGAANNIGADQPGGWRHLLLVNPDAELVAGCVLHLFELSVARPRLGIGGGRTMSADGKTSAPSCFTAPTWWSLTCFALGLTSAFRGHRVFDPESIWARWSLPEQKRVDIVSGALMLIPAAVWRRLDGFDATFFLYGEDADLCLRAAELGLQCWVSPLAMATHAVGASQTRSDKLVLLHKGKATLLRKHWRWPALAVGLLQMGVGLRAVIGPEHEAWRGAWQRRSQWRRGYKSVPHCRRDN